MLSDALRACSSSGISGSAGPSLLDLTREECLGLLRRRELRLYGDAVSVMRAQGALTESKRDLLRGLRSALGVSEARHRCECRRAALDEELAVIADWVFGRDTAGDWREEGRSVVPALDWSPAASPTVGPVTEAARRADAVAAEQRRKQQRKAVASMTASSTELPPALLKEQQRAFPEPESERSKVKHSGGRASKPAVSAAPNKPTSQMLSRATQRQEELLAAAEELRRQLLASTSQPSVVEDQRDDVSETVIISNTGSTAATATAAVPALSAAPTTSLGESQPREDPLAQATSAAIAGDLVTLANVAVSAHLPPQTLLQQQATQPPPPQVSQAPPLQALSTPTRPPVLVQTSESVQTPIYIVSGPALPADTNRVIQHHQQPLLQHHHHNPQILQPQQQQQQTVRVISRPGTAGFGKPVIVVQKPALGLGAPKIVTSQAQPQHHQQLLFAPITAARPQPTHSAAALPVHGVDLDDEPLPQPAQSQMLPHFVGPTSTISMSMALSLAASAAAGSGQANFAAAPTAAVADQSGSSDWRIPALDLLDRLSRSPDSRRPAAECLAGIRDRLLAGEYRCLEELDADVRLMKGAGADLLAVYEAELAGLRDRIDAMNGGAGNNNFLGPSGCKKRRY